MHRRLLSGVAEKAARRPCLPSHDTRNSSPRTNTAPAWKIDGTKVTDAGIRDLRQALPKLKITH
jgi:hypothetical protein